ncbi:unnamed protein product [Chilo suppressalis]|uniref:Ketosynthase family 3 (KS3) domain-containing protein n=1 Tax=Chilo suppressalis TaxID=168631 RepID=A0ABN8B127_CHISP|nr:unnamed protein product [Chilo suppressalis]
MSYFLLLCTKNIFYDILQENPITAEAMRWTSNHPGASKYTGTVPGLERFDAQFFKVNYNISKNMDAMSRKILEQTYQALYDAGVSPDQLSGKKVGVYIGTCVSETEKAGFYDVKNMQGFGIPGCNKAMFANRISYWLNLRGPSMSIDEACCSSSAALDLAYQAMSKGECEAAIVGGANLLLHPETSIHTGRIISVCPDGKTRSFDANGNGCALSEAIPIVFLQKSKNALRAYAKLIHMKNEYIGTQSGSSNLGLCRNPAIFSKFLMDFYDEAKVAPEDVKYVEAVGIGIPDSDKAELEAISKVFCNKNRTGSLLLGSVISKIGYTAASMGLCSLIKVLLAYHTGKIPANLHYSNPPSDVPALQDGRIRIVTEHEPFTRGYIGINNHSITGCSTHLLMNSQFKPKDYKRYKSSIPHLVTISGRQESAVQKIFDDLKSRPVDPEELALFHNFHSANITGHLARGFMILDTDAEQKTVSLSEQVEYFDDARRPLWFVYSGMGSQWTGMGTQLMRIPIFAAAIRRCQRALEPKGIDLVHIITSTDKNIFDNILHSFVGIAAVQIGLTDILRELGLVPDKIIGHSVGELGCAYADGCFTAEEMILSAYSRGLVSVQTPFIRGSMAAIGIGYEKVKDMLPPEIDVACHNSAESSTISGPADVVQEFVANLSSKGIFAKEVACSNIAYHSRYIAKAGPELLKNLTEVIKEPKQRSDRWVSTSVPRDKWDELASKTSSAQYHTNNLLSPVLFEETATLIPSNAVLVEIAPHGLLQAILKRSLPVSCKHIPLTRRGHLDNAFIVLESIGKLFMGGYIPKASVLYPKIDFPVSTGTPMLSHLVEWAHTERWPLAVSIAANLKNAYAAKFLVCLHDPEYSYLSGHIVKGKNVYPYAAALVAVWDTLAMVQQKTKETLSVTFRKVEFFAQPVLNNIRPLEINVAIHRGQGRFEVMERNSKIAIGYIVQGLQNKIYLSPEINEDTDMIYTDNDIYQILSDREYQYRGLFHSINAVNKSLTKAKLLCNNNWVALIDGMIQLNVLRQKHDAISKPMGIQIIHIDTKEHSVANVTDLNGNNIFVADVDEILDRTRCGGITMESLKFGNLAHSHSETTLRFIPQFGPSDGDDASREEDISTLKEKRSSFPYIALRSKSIGDIKSLTWMTVTEPVSSGVSVTVHYAGLNTVDSMRAEGTGGENIGGDIDNLSYGMDFSGVTDHGVRVMGLIASGAASNRVMALPDLLWPVPKHWTMEDAATVPMPYAFAFYCLAIICSMQRHKSILVHGGTGALGQAVISIALAHGLQVFTTVSDIRKKHFLKQLYPELNEDHIGNSRDNSFGDMVKVHTKGQGVAYVINCTKGELKDVTFSCTGFKCIILDTIQIPSGEKYILKMNCLDNRSYFCVDFSKISNEKINRLKLQGLICEGIRKGYVRPLSRVTYAPLDAPRAFRLLRASQHRGRVLLSLQHLPRPQPRITCSRNQTQILICDNPALGVHLGDKLVKRGATKIVLHLPKSTSQVLYKQQFWQDNGVVVKVFISKFENKNDVDDMLIKANNMGTVEGIHIVTSESNTNDRQKVLNYIDKLSRNLCSSVKYFSVLTADSEFGNDTCINRSQEKLPAIKICLPFLKKINEAPDESSNVRTTYWHACEALEYAVNAKETISLAQIIKLNRSSLLNSVITLADLNVPEHNIDDDVNLGKLGVSIEKVPAIDVFLCNEYNLSLSEEHILQLTVKDLREIEQSIKGKEPMEIKGLDMFFSHFDSDELSSTTETMLLPTLANDSMMMIDDIDITKRYLCIIPGLEGHYEKFKGICERLKIPAIVLQPGLDEPNESIEQIAVRYAKILMQTISVKDNFYLLGYESGVLIALETAAILEKHGFSGTIYLIGATPDEFRTILQTEVHKYKNDKELQTAILKHMYKLICGTELSLEIEEIVEMEDRIELCVRNLLGCVSLSAHYTRLSLTSPYYRIKQALQYEPRVSQLQSKIVFLQPNSSDNDGAYRTLQKFSKQEVVVHKLTLPFAQVLQDLRCASFINQYLEKDVLETYNKMNHCETYLSNAENYVNLVDC